MRWIYTIERAFLRSEWVVTATIDGRRGLGYARHRRKARAMKLAEGDYLRRYPVTAKEVVEANT